MAKKKKITINLNLFSFNEKEARKNIKNAFAIIDLCKIANKTHNQDVSTIITHSFFNKGKCYDLGTHSFTKENE